MRRLATKVQIPPRHSSLVSRARLLERLDEGLKKQMTLVSAPAGFGKTTLVAQWAHRRRQEGTYAIGWLALDADDNDLSRFLDYLLAALDPCAPGLDETLRPLLHAPHTAPADQLLTALINYLTAAPQPEANSGEPVRHVALVLDDLHLITTPEIHAALTFLLEHQPACLHLLLISRADPPLPLPRLRGHGQLLELRQADLAFTPEEVGRFLDQVMRVDLSDEAAAILTGRTEGWIAGLQMAALALQGREAHETSSFVDSFTGTHRYVLDYLLEEVLARQPPQVQTFLLQTSIVDRLTAPLCDALLDSPAEAASADILHYLDTHNLFLVPLEDRRQWYRYHRLFADLLRLRLRRTMPERMGTLHRRAAAWLAEHGDPGAAVDHFLEAGDVDRAASLVAVHAESTVMRGETRTLLRWGEALPPDEIKQRPRLALLYAWALLLGGRPAAEVRRWLDLADAAPATRGWSGAIRGYMKLFQGRMRAAHRLSLDALKSLPAGATFLRQLAILVQGIAGRYREGEPGGEKSLAEAAAAGAAADNRLVAVLGLCAQADLALRRGDARGADSLYRRALRIAGSGRDRPAPVASEPLLGLATLAVEAYRLVDARPLLEKGIRLAEQWSGVAALDGYLLQARLHALQGDHDAMWPILDRAAEVARRFDAGEIDDLLVALFRAHQELRLNRPEPARQFLAARQVQAKAAAEELAGHPSPLRKYEYLLLARLLIADDRIAEVQTVLETLLPHFDRHRARIAIQLLRAVAYHRRGQAEAALAALQEAIHLGERAEMIAVFLEEGEAVAQLLYRALEQGLDTPFLQRVLSAFPTNRSDQRAAGGLIEPLSERELEVLALIARGLTNQEIADRLILSLATVKWHTSNIYGKLAVSNRTEAVARARAMGVL